MRLRCDSRYIILPVSHQAEKRSLRFLEMGKLIFELKVGLDFANPEVEFYYNIERFAGKEIELAAEPEIAMEIRKSNAKYPSEEKYNGKHRPGFHFSSQRGWLNDPNGLVYYRGVYHMFYQYNPVGCIWGNMHWGHAVSSDLVHWEEKEPALYPDETGTIFSGSAIADYRNVTGLKQNENDVILLYYTAAGNSDSELSRSRRFAQCLAYSSDGGKTFEKYSKNPVVPFIEHENRDPKVIYDQERDIYVMVLYLAGNRYLLLTSSNLLEWEQMHEIILPEDAECPDFYPLALDDNVNNIKWVFSGASDRYLIGSFDGRSLRPETGTKKLQYSSDSYAAQTWSGISSADDRRIRIAWKRFDMPSMPFNMSMDFPCEMKLKTFDGEAFLCAYPVREIEGIRGTGFHACDVRVSPSEKFSRPLAGRLYDIIFSIPGNSEAGFSIGVFGMKLKGDLAGARLTCCGNSAPLESFGGSIELRLLVDVNGMEIFINKGKAFMSIGHIQDYDMNDLVFETFDREIVLEEINVTELKSSLPDSACPESC